MEKNFFNIEDLIADERFQSWYFKTNDRQRLEWETWMTANPHQAALVAEATEYMDSLMVKERQIPENQVIAAEQRLMDTIHEQEEAVVVPMYAGNHARRVRQRWWMAAAAVVLVAMAGLLFLHRPSSSIHTAYGEVREQQLPDGSKVMLNANSEIRYSKGWEQGVEREVWIKGEAFFHVAKTPSKSRFVVHTDQ